jgi:hypothetical protein
MKRLFVVESDTNYSCLFAYEITAPPDFSGEGVTYSRPVGEPTLTAYDPKVFFGHLNSMLVTAQTVENSKPMELVAPEAK